MENTVHILLHAGRRLRHAPLFAVMSVLTLAIGIGASALMLSVVSTILLKPLPYGDPDRIEMLWGSYPDANLGVPEQPTHGAVFRIIRDNTKAFESIAAFCGAPGHGSSDGRGRTLDSRGEELPPARTARAAAPAGGGRRDADAHEPHRRRGARALDCVREHRAAPPRATADQATGGCHASGAGRQETPPRGRGDGRSRIARC